MSQSSASRCQFETWETGRQGNLHGWFAYAAEPAPSVVCVVVHGLGEHADRYRELAMQLAPHGVATVAYDQQGHGRSPGRRGAPNSYDGMLADIAAVSRHAAERLGDVPQVLVGHSMGGNLATNFVLRHPGVFAGLLLIAPMLLPPATPKRDQIFAAWLTGKMVPFWRFRLPVSTDKLTRDEVEAARLSEDPLIHHRLSLRLGTQLLAQGRWSLDQASRIEVPVLVLHGEQDTLSEIRASESLCVRCGPNATLERLPEMHHDLLHERDRERVWERIIRWLRPFTVRDVKPESG